MKPIRILSAILLMIIGTTGCEKEQILPDPLLADQTGTLKGAATDKNTAKNGKATGFVELTWKGADKGGDKGNKPDDLLVFFELNALEGIGNKAPKGELVYRVLNLDSSLHREIKALVYAVVIDADLHKGRVLAKVISDSKGCSGGNNGGHDSNCSSGGSEGSGGGCSDGTDGGEVGCSDGADGTAHDEGCSHEDTGGDEGSGCSGEDEPEGGMGGSPGGDDKGNPVSGKNCRLGQVIALKVHDQGTPGINGDGITWKWFIPEIMLVPSIEYVDGWKNLCKKTIIGGNIVVHDK